MLPVNKRTEDKTCARSLLEAERTHEILHALRPSSFPSSDARQATYSSCKPSLHSHPLPLSPRWRPRHPRYVRRVRSLGRAEVSVGVHRYGRREGRLKRRVVVVVVWLGVAAWRWWWWWCSSERWCRQWVPPLTPPKGPRNPIKAPRRSPGPSRGEGKGKVGPSVSRQGIGIQFWRRLGAS